MRAADVAKACRPCIAALDTKGLPVIKGGGGIKQLGVHLDGQLLAQAGFLHGIFRMADDLAEGFILHGGDGQAGHVRGGGVVLFIVITVGVDEVAARHAQLPGFFVHPLSEFFDAARVQHGDGVGRVVAAFEHQAVQQVTQRHLLAVEYGHLRAVGRDIPGLPWDSDHLVRVHRFQRQQQGHDLGGAGGVHAGVCFLLQQQGAIIHIDQDRGFGV